MKISVPKARVLDHVGLHEELTAALGKHVNMTILESQESEEWLVTIHDELTPQEVLTASNTVSFHEGDSRLIRLRAKLKARAMTQDELLEMLALERGL
ncbi:MAG: hypothetical protein L0177_07605 [Chloroflexi bacterium]|nr:hypothetical protein [Chloroflexota bacterium]